ncbi:hypothetical protein UFOVP26_112 [uncultured Caudovirales phage]|uniref:Uncharacterized protein n=1 Tax=uncultured Caudovirales phage TaxID=2100421 RepID=A0A6J7WPC4_9CAUD|nr:hypothetical protein UFOVP26_112 [uncultured Caudovirales phage]CAB4124008.1 hypothetical protein UFOVP44_123 [uncultured Caudovirales phage]CAB5219640.1 hypothetical protein UFOVP220_114 [uncultured Caudovirales phage]
MYTIVLDEGSVIRDEDQVVISPCNSPEDPNFVAYLEWIYAGNDPAVIDTRQT